MGPTLAAVFVAEVGQAGRFPTPAHAGARPAEETVRRFARASSVEDLLAKSRYRGGYGTVRDYLRPFRELGAAPPAVPPQLKVRDVTSWMLR